MNFFILAIGLSIVALVIVRLAISIHQSLQRMQYNTQADLLSLQLLEQKISVAQREFENTNEGWNGYRKFEIAKKKMEADNTCSFYLKPHDGKSISAFRPGQYLTFRLNIPGQEKAVIRCYSLSDCFCPDYYRVTIKKVLPPPNNPMQPPGLVSSYFHEDLNEGDIVDVQAPNGHFVLDPKNDRPAVLIAGGVGITPILSMAKSIAAAESTREFFVFYGVRHGQEHAFKEELAQLEQNHNCRVIVCYSDPTENDLEVEGVQYQHHGWVSVGLMKSYLASTNYEFYICGPPPLMASMSEQLKSWGVADANVFTEAFGPATIKKVAPAKKEESKDDSDACQVVFEKSNVTVKWNPDTGNLLDFALENGVEIPSGCRAGNCGTCTIAIKSGSVQYVSEPGAQLEEGSCLTCIASPDDDLILDA